MLLDKQNTIQSDHQGMLEEQFEHITYLLNNDKTENAIELLLNLHYADLADFIDNASKKHYYVILPKIADKINPEFLACLSDGNKQRAIEALGITKSANLINNLDIEDGLEVIDDLSVNLKKAIIDKLNPEKRKQILEGFQYGENTAGRILEKSFVAFKQHWTAGQAIDYIRRSKIQTDFHADVNLSIVFASAVLINFVIAGFLGSGIPILLNYLNVDPAAASGVFLTACTDAIGFFSFLSLAYFFLV